MPLYIVNSKAGAMPQEAKAALADDLTEIHCRVTDAPPTFVHVFFFEDGPNPPLGDKSAMVYGQIRAGRTDAQKSQIWKEMAEAVVEHAGIPAANVHAFTSDTPASWVMEGGDVLPEPGEEEAWLARHEAKMATERANA
jgi:phenylpyruvate tautomerase PptA (4-oxalocrotonate tautomerase family)